MAGFTVQVFENSSLEVSEKKRNRSNTSTGARPDRKLRFILGELFDTWSWQPNDRKWFWLDGIESCCVGVEGSSKSICVRRFSPSPLSLFRFHLSPFPQKRLILRLLAECRTSFRTSSSLRGWKASCAFSGPTSGSPAKTMFARELTALSISERMDSILRIKRV